MLALALGQLDLSVEQVEQSGLEARPDLLVDLSRLTEQILRLLDLAFGETEFSEPSQYDCFLPQ